MIENYRIVILYQYLYLHFVRIIFWLYCCGVTIENMGLDSGIRSLTETSKVPLFFFFFFMVKYEIRVSQQHASWEYYSSFLSSWPLYHNNILRRWISIQCNKIMFCAELGMTNNTMEKINQVSKSIELNLLPKLFN